MALLAGLAAVARLRSQGPGLGRRLDPDDREKSPTSATGEPAQSEDGGRTRNGTSDAASRFGFGVELGPGAEERAAAERGERAEKTADAVIAEAAKCKGLARTQASLACVSMHLREGAWRHNLTPHSPVSVRLLDLRALMIFSEVWTLPLPVDVGHNSARDPSHRKLERKRLFVVQFFFSFQQDELVSCMHQRERDAENRLDVHDQVLHELETRHPSSALWLRSYLQPALPRL